jgi:hypothetical protein
MTGTIQGASGCQAATDCRSAGVCDALTQCTMDGDSPACSACPAGYQGSGKEGCAPTLLALTAMGGELTPALSPTERNYRVKLPLLRQQVQLAPKAPAGVRIEIDGAKLAEGKVWSSPVVPLGEHPVALVLTGSNGMSTRYQITLDHGGVQEAFIKAGKPDTNDAFGFSVAMSGDTLVVGSPSEDGANGGQNGDESSNGASESGAVYIYVRSGSTWTREAYLKSNSPTASEFFGCSIAIDGDLLLVGAAGMNPYPNRNSTSRSGAVYVFKRNGGQWKQEKVIESPEPVAGNLFGYSVLLTADTFVIGSPYDEKNGRHSGAVYVGARSDAWGPLTAMRPKEPLVDSIYGWSSAADGNTLIIGAPAASIDTADGPGTAYVYTREASGQPWVEGQTLQQAKPIAGANFGWAVAVQGEMMVVGAPRAALVGDTPPGEAYVFQRANGTWNPTGILEAGTSRDSDYYGTSVALAGNVLLVGASGDMSGARGLDADPNRSDTFQSGAFYLYGLQDGRWVQSAYVKTDNPKSSTQMAEVAVISGDTIIAGAMNEPSAYGGINPESRGNSVGAGAVYVFR